MVLRDITESKVMAERLRQQDRLAAVGRLAAGIAHDFNNIMSVVVLYAQLAQRNLGQEEETAREQMRVIHDQALQATKLIEQILDFSRKAPLERRPMSLLPYLKEIMKLWQRTLPENIDIVLDVTDVETLRVSADPTRIQQALMNLATNARDAMPKGGTLRIKVRRADYARASDVPLPDMSPGAWVRLDFVDTGVGIPSDVLSHVFEPFYTTKTTGSGLGLAQVHGIVKQHGGEVDIESEVGAGTRVTIYLPLLVEAPPASIPAPAMQEMPLGQGKQVLVVEDNAKTREALAAALDALNYRSITVRNGREALEALVRWGDEIDVILTDAVMPEMGAAELLQTLASKQLSFPVIVLSGYLEPEQREKLRETGPLVTWLTKPVDLLDLASALSHALPNDRAS
jgi:nitrogen-specific signal transduction histidine kinase/ActR/RegA family two-component response regulator